jgi:hypothetical protein
MFNKPTASTNGGFSGVRGKAVKWYKKIQAI